ncbi:Protein of unknown function [Cotesia congregata]|uniref:RING-type domain-containing protein n=1 Tax=Cotesia congregata TaxID=51543 RepID=A0A8J2HD10_COTCN|nr:Protein of unknown function [Cotesia congregata]
MSKETMMCGICIQSITDAHAVTNDVCKHCFHLTCVKVRYVLDSIADVADYIADKCPICLTPQPQPESITKILENINEKLGLIRDVKMQVHGKVRRNITADILVQGARKLPVYINRRFPSTLYKLRQSIVRQFPMVSKKNVWIAAGAFRDHFRVLDYDVIAVSESWLSSNVVDAQMNLPEFQLLRNDWKTRHGGSVLLFIGNTLSSRIINCSSNLLDGYPEYIIAEV